MQNPAAPAPHFRETKANDQATLKPFFTEGGNLDRHDRQT